MLKKRSGKNLIHFFYHLLVVLFMSLPILSGLVRVIYVQANQNAFESYYGDTINQEQFDYLSFDDLIVDNTYYFRNELIGSLTSNVDRHTIIYVSNVVNYTTDTSFDYSTLVSLDLYLYTDNVPRIAFTGINGYITTRALNSNALNFSFTFNGISNLSVNPWLEDYDIVGFDYFVEFSYLDNAFDYSIWKTMQDFTFHSDFRFTDLANGLLMTFDNNNLYIQYANFYINWLLTCAVISFAPYVLLSFYHLAIHLLDKFMSKGEDL